MKTTAQLLELSPERPRNNFVIGLLRFTRNRMAVIGGIILFIFVVVTIFAPLISPYDANYQYMKDRLKGPSAQYLMGTDKLGRDVLSRSIMACRISLTIGLLSMAIAMGVGVAVGVLAGFYGGILDNILMRLTDLTLSFPMFFLLLTIASVFGPNISTIILMIGLTSWGSTARIMRGMVLSIRETSYIEAARAVGVKNGRIIIRHVLVNSLSVITVTSTLMVAYAILVEGGLSYLGLGVQPPTPSWGNMMADGRDVLRTAWWPSLVPGAFLLVVVIAFNLLGDGLRDFFDPAKQIAK